MNRKEDGRKEWGGRIRKNPRTLNIICRSSDIVYDQCNQQNTFQNQLDVKESTC